MKQFECSGTEEENEEEVKRDENTHASVRPVSSGPASGRVPSGSRGKK